MTEEDGSEKKGSKQVCGKASNPDYLSDRRRDTRNDLKGKEERGK